MTISTFERNATIAEMAVEIDRRGAVIERLEAERDTLTAALAASTAREKAKDEEIEGLRKALTEIAAFDDTAASAYFAQTGSYSAFDEPGAVILARAALSGRKPDKEGT